jgi:hypothetical protein
MVRLDVAALCMEVNLGRFCPDAVDNTPPGVWRLAIFEQNRTVSVSTRVDTFCKRWFGMPERLAWQLHALLEIQGLQ